MALTLIRQKEHPDGMVFELLYDDEKDVYLKRYYQPLGNVLRAAHDKRSEYSKNEDHGDMLLTAVIPEALMIDWQTNHGFNLLRDKDDKWVKKQIEQHYPRLKTIDGNI